MIDLPLLGKKFTWSEKYGKCSRIDRCCVSMEWMDIWGHLDLSCLDNDLLDHNAIRLGPEVRNWGIAPFRFQNQWANSSDFFKMCEEQGSLMTVVGSSSEKLMHKFRRLKIFLKKWSKEKFWNVESELSACKMSIQSIEEAPLWDLDSEQKLFDLKLKKAKLDRDLEIKWRQRAIISWLKEGDLMQKGDHWLVEPKRVKDHFHHSFKNHFSLKHNLCPDLNLSNLSLNQISDASNQFLSQSFSRDEIKAALDQINGSKAPGPDGFNFFFIKKAWFFLEVEIVQIFQDFFDDATIPEVLANRIRKVLPEVVEENQCAFVEGRFILDGVMTVSELISDLKLNRTMGLILKLDFAKAFDSVSWVFLSKVMSSMGFNSSFCNWVHSCVSSARISVLVNGSSYGIFNLERGLRQGDPLSPFLFLLVAKVLNKMIKYSLSNGNLKGIKINNGGDPLTHIQFADDTILFGDNSLEEMATWKSILEQFGDASGLKLNWDKCQLFGINVSLDELSLRAGIINCKADVLPMSYLGFPIGSKGAKSKLWDVVIQKIKQRLAGWKRKTLSIGGRLVLIKSVIASLPLYFMSLFKAPKLVLNQMEKLMRQFLWGGGMCGRKKICRVTWSKVSNPIVAGGLGVTPLKFKNIALLSKWIWKLYIPKSEVWKRLVMLRYGSKSDWAPINSFYLVSSKISRTGKDILGFKLDDIGSLCCGPNMWKWEIGDGSNIHFWEDCWAFSDPIRHKFPPLFLACSNKRGKVNEFWIDDDACWVIPFNRPLVAWESLQYSQLLHIINSFRLKININDKLIWLGNSDRVFKVHDAIKCLSSGLGGPQGRWIDFVWKSFTPPKVKFFMWTINMNSVPKEEFLKIRGVKFKDYDADCNCLVSCPIPCRPFNIWWLSIASAVFWSIWQSRNQLSFENNFICWKSVVLLAKSKSCNWLIGAKKLSESDKSQWFENPSLLAF
ncbi:hypothetical protein CTI12_AA335310 [Artemisia annua]|uniref:Reverse transcriptase domain-containing protein n=1 Tax=Artemisia annua TaxID=35608 RepID=A0A2U1MW63_ARTAN|nr:hypothetical protein CTI12_AA335310 [Artemisia annua]